MTLTTLVFEYEWKMMVLQLNGLRRLSLARSAKQVIIMVKWLISCGLKIFKLQLKIRGLRFFFEFSVVFDCIQETLCGSTFNCKLQWKLLKFLKFKLHWKMKIKVSMTSSFKDCWRSDEGKPWKNIQSFDPSP